MHASVNDDNIDIRLLYSIILQYKKGNYIRYDDDDDDDVAKIGLRSPPARLHDGLCTGRSQRDN